MIPFPRMLDGVELLEVVVEDEEPEDGIGGDIGGETNLPDVDEYVLGLVKEAERSFVILDLPLVSLTLFIGSVSCEYDISKTVQQRV